MKNAVKVFTYLVLSFMMLYAIAGMFSGVLLAIMKAVAFGVPLVVGIFAARKLKTEREEIAGLAERESMLMGINKESVLLMLPLIVPVIALVFLVSYLTTLALGAFGMSAPSVEETSLFNMILVHALVPAVLEESVFRYLPMKLLAPYSRRWCVILSSLYFAFIHMSIYQLPYAFLAGLIFIIIDIICDSVLPSLILHFLNNSVSVLWIKYSDDSVFATRFVIIMVVTALLSMIPVIIRGRRYLKELRRSMDAGDRLTDYAAPLVFCIFCGAMTLLNL